MSPYGLPKSVIDEVIERRGTLHAYETLEPRQSALVVIDMQPHFLEEGAPAECAEGSAICSAINDLTKTFVQMIGTCRFERKV